MRRSLAELEARAWDAAAIQRCHVGVIEHEYSVRDVVALFAAYGRLQGSPSVESEVPTESERSAIEALKASWNGT